MSSGPFHYAEAERLAAAYKAAIDTLGEVPVTQSDLRFERISLANALLTKAQVHATLALAAATVTTLSAGPCNVPSDWFNVLYRRSDKGADS